MQVSMNAEDANVRPRRDRRDLDSGAVERQSLRLIDLHQELPGRADFSRAPAVRFFEDDPFGAPSLEGLPPALMEADHRDPFDLSHLRPPPSFAKASKSTPSLPIAVAAPKALPSDFSTSSDHTSMSSASLRLSSSADSALAALPPPPPPPEVPRNDEVDACGCHNHPDLPPRAVLPTADRPRILPILENGQRTSYTHYWVIPQRNAAGGPERLAGGPSSGEQHYVNVKCPAAGPALVSRSASMPPRSQPRERRYVKRPSCEPDQDLLGCATNRAFVDDAAEIDAPLLEVAQVVSSVESDSSWEAQQQQQQQPAAAVARSVPTSDERRARIVAVRDAVHGVTDEEAQMILQTHRWEVARSVRLLKVEQLFRLGVTPTKSICKRILDDAGGDLALASERLIKQQTSK